jgi:hypothetical protein
MRYGLMQRVAAVTLLLVIVQPVRAVPVGSGALLMECANPICCAQYDFAPGVADVFGTPVELAGGEGTLVSTDTIISDYDMVTGVFAGTSSSLAPGVFAVGAAGSFGDRPARQPHLRRGQQPVVLRRRGRRRRRLSGGADQRLPRRRQVAAAAQRRRRRRPATSWCGNG